MTVPISPTNSTPLTPHTQGGSLHIDPAATHNIIRAAALSVPGCCERPVGIGRLTGKTLPQADITTDGPYVAVEVHIAVSWPSPVSDVARCVRTTIRHHLETYLAARVTKVDVVVDSVSAAPASGKKARPPRITHTDLENFNPVPPVNTVIAPCSVTEGVQS